MQIAVFSALTVYYLVFIYGHERSDIVNRFRGFKELLIDRLRLTALSTPVTVAALTVLLAACKAQRNTCDKQDRQHFIFHMPISFPHPIFQHPRLEISTRVKYATGDKL